MISVEMQGGRICLLFVVGAVMGQSIRKLQNFLVFSHANLHNFLSTMMAIYHSMSVIACEKCWLKSLKVNGCVRNASLWSG